MIKESLSRSLIKSTSRASIELGIPKTTVWRVLKKRLHCCILKPYKLQLQHAQRPNDYNRRYEFCADMPENMATEGFSERLVLSDEAAFHTYGRVNSQNGRIWGTENNWIWFLNMRAFTKISQK